MDLVHFEEIAMGIRHQKPEKNENPVNRDSFPFTQEDSEFLVAVSNTAVQQDILAPVSKSALADLMVGQFLPALRQLKFIGVDPIPEVHVFAGWSNTDNAGIKAVRYRPGPLNLMDEHDRHAASDIALTNARDGEVPLTIGRVQPLLFFRWFCHAVVKTDGSTAAHRRYKDRFGGARFHLIVDADYNNVELHVDNLVAAAMNDAAQCFAHGR